MSAVNATPAGPAARRTLLEVRLLAGRSLRHIPRVPEKLAGAIVMPIIFVFLFGYVFGSAIDIPGMGGYHAYLVSGVFAQAMMSPLPGIAVGVASDLHSGLVDRLRTLPISRWAVLAGRAISELCEMTLGLAVLTVCGLIVGWAPHGSVLETLGAYGLLVLFAFAVTWAGTLLGLLVRGPEGADGIAMSGIFPLMFLSGIFVPIGGLPAPLRQIAEYNPISALATAVRTLFHNPTPALPDVWPLQHPVIASLLWALALIAVFAPLATRRFRRLAGR